ncbi:transposase family protein [Streptomyces sp. NPDC005917]|uniref:transposase family protein n=1 Tax=unclassified Streptomyces TaxID=2593676 RepID=UPI0033F24808
MEFLYVPKIRKGAVPVAPSLLMRVVLPDAPSVAPGIPEGLLEVLAQVPDPRDPPGVRYRLATLLVIGFCAMTTAGHNSLVSINGWARRCDQRTLASLGCPYHPLTGRVRCPDEKTLRATLTARSTPAS